MAHIDEKLNQLLARDIRAYLTAAEPMESAAQQKRCQNMCNGASRLLGRLLEGQDGWPECNWVDAIAPRSVKIVSPVSVEIEGLAIWGEELRGQWMDPLAAWIMIDPAVDSIETFELRFGDASRGIGRVGYSISAKRQNWDYPDEWKFSFKFDSKTPGAGV